MPAEKTKGFFHKKFKNLTNLLPGRYRKLSKPSQTLCPFSCGTCREHGTKVVKRCDYVTRNVRTEFSEKMYKEEKTAKQKVAGSSEREKKQWSSRLEKMMTSEGEFELARRMKELEMMGAGNDVEQALDVEEALHYYSRLKSPVYLEIVDRFFMDMYGDFYAPQQPPLQLQQYPSALSKSGGGSDQSGSRFRGFSGLLGFCYTSVNVLKFYLIPVLSD